MENIQQRILGHFGQSGSGKTYALEQDTLDRWDEGRRIFVLDYKREWAGVPDRVACAACLEKAPGGAARREWKRRKCELRACIFAPTLDEAKRRFAEVGFAVLRLDRDKTMGPRPRGDVPLVERVADWALDTSSLDLVLPEAHMYLPLGQDAAMGVQTEQLITQFRDYDIGVAYDSQFFANLSMRLRKQTNVFRIFGFAEGTPDMVQVENLGGPALVAAIRQCAEKHAKGQPGWHVFSDPRVPLSAPKIARY